MVTASSRQGKFWRLGEMLWTVWRYRKWADFVLIDTYSTWNFWYAVAVAALCRRLGLRYIPILHGGELPERRRRSPRASEALFVGAYVNVAPSKFLILNSEFRIRNLKFIPNSITLENYAFRARRNVSPKILWVRAFQDIYDPLKALKTLQQLLLKYPGAEVCMVGPRKDASLEVCREYARQHGLPVTFAGKLGQGEWTALAQGYDLFLNTSEVDNAPVTLIEAMALGLPIVSTRVGGLPYLLTHEENGLLVPSGTPEDLSAALERLLEDPALAERLSQAGREKAEGFDWQVVRHRWAGVLGDSGPVA